MRWTAAAAAFAAVLAIAGGYAVYPFWTLQQIGEGIAVRDADAVAPFVDWEKLKQGIKADVSVSLLITAKRSGQTSPGATLAADAMGGLIADRLVDTLVSPAALRRAFVNEPDITGQIDPQLVWARFAGPAALRFQVKVARQSDIIVSGMLELEGGAWRLTRLTVPDEIMRDGLQRGQTTMAVPTATPKD